MYYRNTLKITFQNTKFSIKTVLKSVEISINIISVVAFIVVINQFFGFKSLGGVILVLSLI